MERERRRLRDLQDDLQREHNRIRWTVSNQRELDQPRFRSSEHSGTTENQARPSKRVRSPDIHHENSEPRRSRLEKHALQSDKSASPSFSTKDVMNILKSLKQLPSQPSTYSALTTSSNHKNILPDFDPSSKNQRIDSWLNKVNECATVYGWDEKTTIHFSMQKLQGLAKTWYESLPSILYNWTEWQSKLINAFPCEQNYGQTLEEMLRRKTKLNEPIEVYFYEKLAMLNQCNIEGKRAVDCIIHGLTDRTLKSSAITLRCTHPEQLLQFLMSNKESSHLIDRMHYKFIPGTDSSNLDNNNSSAYKVEKVMSQNNNIFCYNCKEKGHPFLKCPKPILKCGKCNKIGHRIEDCFNIHVNIVPTKCFIDFGSEVSLIKQSQASRLGLFYSDRPTALKGFGNEIVRTLGSVSVDVSVDGVVANVICQVVDDHYLELPILIGQSFTEQSHVAVYKTEDKLSFFHTCSEMPFSGVHIQNIAPVKLVAVSDVNVNGLASIKVTVDKLWL
ncbi:hypothetical protein ABMA27_009706 [Loxostege sticticalis]|uniref:CCHC-type domain-containing protein n=1 Tax=Loxostege sticticalis TaxID=481309 RepID=A0ABR3H665_LOXSC